LFRHKPCGFCWVGTVRSSSRQASAASVSFMSLRLAPSTTPATGLSCASVSRLRLTQPLPRSAGLGVGFFPAQWCFGHTASHGAVNPVHCLQRYQSQSPEVIEDTSYPAKNAGGKKGWSSCRSHSMHSIALCGRRTKFHSSLRGHLPGGVRHIQWMWLAGWQSGSI
jgi:hypothetical protein